MKENSLNIQVKPIGQYAKSISFDSYKNKQELATISAKPQTETKLATIKEKLTGNVHRVILQLEVLALADKDKIFKAALEYAGEFEIIGDLSEEALEEILLVNCLTLLFPFARQIIAETCVNGGYPAILLDPINFKNIYLSYKKKQTEQTQSKVANAN